MVSLLIICVLAIVLLIGGLFLALTKKETGHAAVGALTAGLILLGILFLILW